MNVLSEGPLDEFLQLSDQQGALLLILNAPLQVDPATEKPLHDQSGHRPPIPYCRGTVRQKEEYLDCAVMHEGQVKVTEGIRAPQSRKKHTPASC